MSTTTLIVEVVIIGAQVLTWICLAIIALFGASCYSTLGSTFEILREKEQPDADRQ